MAHGLETRVPFLDNDLVNFAQKIPVKFKIKKVNIINKIDENEIGKRKKVSDGKMIFRKSISKYMPKDINQAVKQGFSSPDQSWFRGESIDFVKAQLFNIKDGVYKYLNRKTVQLLIKDHINEKKNRRLFIWSLLNFKTWLKLYG